MASTVSSNTTTLEVESELIEYYRKLSQTFIDGYLNDAYLDKPTLQKLDNLYVLLIDPLKASEAKFNNFYSEIQAMLVHGHAPAIKHIIRHAIRDSLKLYCGEPIKNKQAINSEWTPVQIYAWMMCKVDEGNVLTLYDSKLDALSPSQWHAFCHALGKARLESLMMKHTYLNRLSAEQWIGFCNGVANSTITALGLKGNNLGYLSDKQWTAFCNGFANSNITSLNLSANDLDYLADEQWTAFWEDVANSHITALDLSGNDLDYLADEQWTAFWEGVANSHITALDLGSNGLHYLADEQWKAFWEGVANSNITALDLGSNGLHNLADEQWKAFWEGVANSNITSLYISFNNLNKLSEEQFTTFWNGVTNSNITALDLNGNGLNRLSDKQWTAFWNGVTNSHIISMDLSCNRLFKLNAEQWAIVKAALKNSDIIQLDLRFNKLTAEQFAEIELILEYNFLNPIHKTKTVTTNSDTITSDVSSSERLVSMATDSDTAKTINRTPTSLREYCLFFAAKKTSNASDVMEALEQAGHSELAYECNEIKQNVGVKPCT